MIEESDFPGAPVIVLVTGGNGIVGSHVVEALLADGSFSRVVATHHRNREHQQANAVYHTCDVTSISQVKTLLDNVNPAVIIHTVSPGPFAPAKLQYHVNFLATRQIVELSKQHPSIRALIYTSSVEAVDVGSTSDARPKTENEAVLNELRSGTSAYARTKGAADGLVLCSNAPPHLQANEGACKDYQGTLLTACLRIGGLYGERDEKTTMQLLRLANTFAARVQIGPNTSVQDWVYTKNVALAHVLAAKALLRDCPLYSSTKVHGEAFYITDGLPMRFWDFSRKMLIQAGDKRLIKDPPEKIITIPFEVMLCFAGFGELLYQVFTFGHRSPKMSRHHFDFMKRGCWFSIEKARQRLGYMPICDTEEGIRRTVAWFKATQA